MRHVIALLFTLLLAFTAQAQTLPGGSAPNQDPKTVFFFGGSADPNGSLSSITGDIGGAKLVGSSTYLGGVAHLGRGDAPNRLKTKIQLHYARKVTTFRNCGVLWTVEVGPDFLSGQALSPIPPSTTPGNTGNQIGYAIGSGPAVSIPIGKQMWLMPHAEVTKGSLEDLGWRGGVLLVLGSN